MIWHPFLAFWIKSKWLSSIFISIKFSFMNFYTFLIEGYASIPWNKNGVFGDHGPTGIVGRRSAIGLGLEAAGEGKTQAAAGPVLHAAVYTAEQQATHGSSGRDRSEWSRKLDKAEDGLVYSSQIWGAPFIQAP